MSNIFFEKIKSHNLAVLISIFFTLAIVSPRLISRILVGNEFRGIYPTFIEDEVHYETRIRDILNGRFGLGNPYIKEHQADVFIQPPLAEWILAFFAYVTGLSVPLSIILSNFIIIPLFFLLTYWLFYKILKNKLLSVGFTSFFFLVFFQTFGRPISPQLTSIFLLVGLILIHKIFYEDGLNLFRLNLILGLNIGLTLFISPYYWTTLLLLYFFVVAYKTFWVKPFLLVTKEFLYFLASFVPPAFIYAYFVLKVSGVEVYSEVSTRFGMVYSHWPGSYTNIVFGVLSLALVLLVYKSLNRKDFVFSSFFGLSIFILNWQNVITGQALQFPSHYLVVTVLFTLLTIALVTKSQFEESSLFSVTLKKSVVFSFIALILVAITLRQKAEFTNWVPKVPSKEELVLMQEKNKIYDWFELNSPRNSVVYALGRDFGRQVAVYTDNKVFYDPYGALYLISDDEVEERWLIQNYFVPKIDVSYLRKNQKDFWWNRYVDSYFFNQNKTTVLEKLFNRQYERAEMLPDSLFVKMIERQNKIKKLNPKDVFSKYEIDYLLLSKNYEFYAETRKTLSKMTFIKPVYETSEAIIYTVD